MLIDSTALTVILSMGVGSIGLLLIVLFWSAAKLGTKTNSRDPSLRDFAFASIDINGDANEVHNEATKCAEAINDLAQFAGGLDRLRKSLELEISDPVARLSTKYRPGTFDLRFCLGDSVAGAGVEPNSLLAIVPLNGARLHAQFERWGDVAVHQPGSKLAAGVFEWDEELCGMRVGGDQWIRRGHLISIEMLPEAKGIYSNVLKEKDKNLYDRLVGANGSLHWNKIRLFGGIKVSTDDVLVKTHRFPGGADRPENGRLLHKLAKLNGVVIRSWSRAEWETLMNYR